MPEKKDQRWVPFDKIVCAHPKSKETKHGKIYGKVIIEEINKHLTVW